MPHPPTGTVFEAQAITLAKTGDGVAEYEGRPLHVAGLLPGERARVRLTYVGRQRAHGDIEELLDAVARRVAPCQRHGDCDSCPLMVVSEVDQAEAKRRMLAALGIEVEQVHCGAGLGYRWSAKRVVGGRAGALRLGSYRRGSHDLADMDGCLVDHPRIVACVDELRRVGSELNVAPFVAGAGELRYVWLKTDGERVLLTLVTATDDPSTMQRLAKELQLPAGVAWCVQSGAGNALRGDAMKMLVGQESLRVAIGGEHVDVGPLGFLQPNPAMASLCYQALVGKESGNLALDLYAGAGATTKLLRERYDLVLACESYSESAAVLGVQPQTADAFVADVLERGLEPQLIIANPPRAGLGAAVCAGLNELASRAAVTLHLMSCEPPALKRDLDRLTAFDRIDATAYDTLPQTAHVEVVVRLRAKKI